MYKNYVKRILDVAASILVLVVSLIPSIIIAILIKLDSRGPILFKQKRAGINKSSFTMYKFRTFHTHAPADLSTREVKDASHITRVGRILRKLSLDEIPQVLNVLRGDMSLIGPRPILKKERKLHDMRHRLRADTVRPGITGWAQVNGRDHMDDETKAVFDAHYVQNLNLVMDIKCVVKTVWSLVSFRGHKEGHENADHDYIPEGN